MDGTGRPSVSRATGSCVDQIAESLAELVDAQMRGGGELRQVVRIVEVVPLQPDHVAPRDRVARGR